MLIICEIHHRGTPLVWHAADEADYIDRVARSAVKSGEDINDRDRLPRARLACALHFRG